MAKGRGMTRKPGPVLIEMDGPAEITPAEAPPIVEMPSQSAALQTAAQFVARPPSRLARWFWSLLLALVGFVASVAAYDFVTGLLLRNPTLGWIAMGLTGLLLAVLAMIAIREWAAFARLGRLDGLKRDADTALAEADLAAARRVTRRLQKLYANRPDLEWGLQRLSEREADMFDADGLLGLAEAEVMAPLDRAAQERIEVAARQVATVTAIVPLALADIFTALTANLRMIRQIAEIYGGRSGTLGSWRLTRSVLTHLVATGAVAVGDDLIGSIAGGSVLSKLSRRFGEGIVNGALTARVGVAAMEVCRPLGFATQKRPSVSGVVKAALAGLFTGR